MYNSPRRPYYNYRASDMPTESGTDIVSIEPRRFWNLLKELKQRQTASKQADTHQKKATTG